jgi:1,4-dihydroxy-2-naphthoate octaprenyltransferase
MPSTAHRLPDIWVRLLHYPTHTLPTAAAPVLMAAGLAVHDGVFAPWPALLAFRGSWLIHVGGVLLDNHELLRRHPGLDENPELTAAVRDHTLRLPHLRAATLACFLLALLPGAWLVSMGGAPAVAIGAAGVAASAGYVGGPAPYARRGLANAVFFAMFGVVAVAATYFVQAAAAHGLAPATWRDLAQLPATAFLIGLPVGALVTSVLVIDDLRDTEFDRTKGWRAIPVRLGVRPSRAEFVALQLLAYAAPIAFAAWFGSPLLLLPMLTAPGAFLIARAVLPSRDRRDLVPMTPRTSMLSCAYAALLALGLGLA